MRIREVRPDELEVLQAIERAAGEVFRAIGMDAVADDAPPSIEVLASFRAEGRAWVSVDDDDTIAAYLTAGIVDGCAHVEQVSVDPAFARRRIGRGLLDHCEAWAIHRGYPAVTLTTFVEVRWNGPYYEQCGFRYLTDAELTDGLRAIRAAERAAGLDRWPRACMRKELPSRAP